MKFLLCAVNAKYIHVNPALHSLRAYAGRELAASVEIAEYTVNQQKWEILGDIYRRRPDAVGFSCYIWNWEIIGGLLEDLPKILPQADLWLGGPEVSYNAQEVMRGYPCLRGIMVGEGEETFRELLSHYVRGAGSADGLEKIAGLCLREGYTPVRDPVDMDRIPFWYEEAAKRGEDFAGRIIYYESSRGCPYRCSYCLSSIDRHVRFRRIETVKRELQFFLEKKVRQVKFVDRTFNCDHSRTLDIWNYVLENDNGVTNFHFEISADLLTQEEIAVLGRMRPGLVQLEIGVQSANPQTLRAVNRTADLDRLERNTAAVRKGRNVHQHLDLIAGLPYEDYGSFARSFDRVYRMRPDMLQLGFLKVLKGSEMERLSGEFGIRFQSRPPYEVLCSAWLDYDGVLRLKRVEEMVELYYNSGQFAHTLAFLERAFASPFAMFEALSVFYEEQGYVLNSPARVYRYRVLLDFAEKYDPAYAAVYRELLTFDLYLRENAKSRPDFAPDLSALREEILAFYRKEAMDRTWLPEYEGLDSRQLSRATHLEPFSFPVWDEGQMAALRGQGGTAISREPGEEAAVLREKGETATLGNRAGENQTGQRRYVLFDYGKRHPVTQEARTAVVAAGQCGSCKPAGNRI